jgi:DNA-binding NarL/FixJ family response regulator
MYVCGRCSDDHGVAGLAAPTPSARECGYEGQAEFGAGMIRVIVVDDEQLIRRGFSMILEAEADVQVVGACAGADAVELCLRRRPDVALVDVRMPDVDGLTVLNRLRALPSPPAVAMLTTFSADDTVLRAIREGAVGFLLKDMDPVLLVAAVRCISAGHAALAPQVTRSIVDRLRNATAAPNALRRIKDLTDRERDVITLLSEGLTNSQIAVRLGIRASTVKDYVSSILTKTASANRISAAVLATKAGLLTSSISVTGL